MMNALQKIRSFAFVMLALLFLVGSTLTACGTKPAENTEQPAAEEAEHPEGSEHPDSTEHPEGEEHPSDTTKQEE